MSAERNCPTCGSDSPFIVQGQCASDVYDPDEWHMYTIRRTGEQVSIPEPARVAPSVMEVARVIRDANADDIGVEHEAVGKVADFFPEAQAVLALFARGEVQP